MKIARGASIALLACAGLTHAQTPQVAHFDVYADGETLHLLVGYGRKGEPEIALYHHLATASDGTVSALFRGADPRAPR